MFPDRVLELRKSASGFFRIVCYRSGIMLATVSSWKNPAAGFC
ncbi:hypothetical protein BOVAC2_3089 [Bacteroides ovatus]|uniref:Uncharacterized protein n=1 Tax=Bacteroides xylanisolvens XB1A TaxID=657309 RepID=D6D0E2_9BACE|nr:hypothetical protein BOVAC2_3089 [Bacteroides ovatus]CBK67894.1 hypothetical protein BXY_28710 [Bacteroides xylanisolvens XB1A]